MAIKRLAPDGERFPLEPDRVSVPRADANAANGMAADRDGQLVICKQGSPSQPAAILCFDPQTGAVVTLLDNWRGLPLNSLNDITVKSDGTAKASLGIALMFLILPACLYGPGHALERLLNEEGQSET